MCRIRVAALGAYCRGANVLPNPAVESDALHPALRAFVRTLTANVKRPMAVTLDKQQSRKRISEIRRLWNEWDPIGVASDANDDEFRCISRSNAPVA